MTSKERQTTETVQAKKDKQQIQAKKDKQQKHKSWLLRLVEKIGTGELGPSSPPPIYRAGLASWHRQTPISPPSKSAQIY
jgi:hypothetical protein